MTYHPYVRTSAALLMLGGMLLCRVSGESVLVTADHVNLRAAPSDQSEVVSQVAKDDVIVRAGREEGDWIAVVPPESVTLWMHGEMVKDGIVTGTKVNVRSGPGTTYKAVGSLRKGDKVSVRDAGGEWIKIAPPPGVELWISRKYVEPLLPPDHASPVAQQDTAGISQSAGISNSPASAKITVSRSEPTRVPVSGPAKPQQQALPTSAVGGSRQELATEPFGQGQLVPEMEQGKRIQYEGVMNLSSFVLNRPSRFILISQDQNGRILSCSYIRGKDNQYDALVGREVSVTGREYWVQGARYSVIVPDRITVITPSRRP